MLSIKEQKIKLRLEIKELRARTSNIDYQKKNDCIKKYYSPLLNNKTLRSYTVIYP